MVGFCHLIDLNIDTHLLGFDWTFFWQPWGSETPSHCPSEKNAGVVPQSLEAAHCVGLATAPMRLPIGRVERDFAGADMKMTLDLHGYPATCLIKITTMSSIGLMVFQLELLPCAALRCAMMFERKSKQGRTRGHDDIGCEMVLVGEIGCEKSRDGECLMAVLQSHKVNPIVPSWLFSLASASWLPPAECVCATGQPFKSFEGHSVAVSESQYLASSHLNNRAFVSCGYTPSICTTAPGQYTYSSQQTTWINTVNMPFKTRWPGHAELTMETSMACHGSLPTTNIWFHLVQIPSCPAPRSSSSYTPSWPLSKKSISPGLSQPFLLAQYISLPIALSSHSLPITMGIKYCLKTLKSSLRRLNDLDKFANDSDDARFREAAEKTASTANLLVLPQVQKLDTI